MVVSLCFNAHMVD